MFVDTTGRRRQIVRVAGWVVAAGCLAYLGAVGVSLSGTTVGPLAAVPAAVSKDVRFPGGADLAPGALELAPAPIIPPAAFAAADSADDSPDHDGPVAGTSSVAAPAATPEPPRPGLPSALVSPPASSWIYVLPYSDHGRSGRRGPAPEVSR